jgi:hypothetical protein
VAVALIVVAAPVIAHAQAKDGGKAAPAAGTEPESAAESEPATESESAAESEPATESESATESGTGSESATESESESATESESESATESESETESETETESDDDSEAEPDAVTSASQYAGGIGLPGDLRLNGRFDILYERTGYNDHPFQSGKDRFRNFHHFVFLSRDSQDDPVTLNAEIVDLSFYELGYLHHPVDADYRIAVRAGKIMIPFGREPNWHNQYGGKAGFDNVLLPPIFAEHGATVQGQYVFPSIGLRARLDLFAVQGYRLRDADGVVNLQSDFSSTEDPTVALGFRAGLSWGPLTARYSGYHNEIGFGRKLYMQALDLELARIRDVPLLEAMNFAAGALRADVRGGGAGNDYYHFGSYIRVRAYPYPWLYLQYRQGLATFDNRRGDYIDDTRLTSDDVSAHNVGIVGRYRGLSVGLYHFWVLEKADEIEDDFTRLAVAYEF